MSLRRRLAMGVMTIATLTAMGSSLSAKQPKVSPNKDEPFWPDILKEQWGLDMDRDLRNPLVDGVEPACAFVKADKNKPVVFRPILAAGMETPTRGGWYGADLKGHTLSKGEHGQWGYTYKTSLAEYKQGKFPDPPLQRGSGQFDPGNEPFGLWISNDNWKGPDGWICTDPVLVARMNLRLKDQPYKAMIYPNRDKKSGRLIANSYIIGWEYSTNDDFQDVVTLIENVRLLPANPPLKGILPAGSAVKKLAGGFAFVEGPAWDFKNNVLYFSDIPPAHIVKFADGVASVANSSSDQSNGLMFDKDGLLVRCEHGGRRLSRGAPQQPGTDIVTRYKEKKLNAPNDLWIDAEGGIYFTDPYYGGNRAILEQDKEAVYYVAKDRSITRIIDELVRPNGIALSPDGSKLYVVDNGADSLHCYPVLAPGRIGKGERIANVSGPDGMTVDAEGRLYVTGVGGVWVLDKNGKWIGLIETPEQPANCTFGGKDWRTLFITARTSLYGVETQTRGWHVHIDGPPKSK